jgi:integrase
MQGSGWQALAAPVLTRLPINGRAAKPYSLIWGEQDSLIQALTRHFHDMTLFKVNAGCREQEVCRLRWDWEVKVPELITSVFIIPAYTMEHGGNDLQLMKNKEDRLVALNSTVRRIIESRRAKMKPTSLPTRPVRDTRKNLSSR